MKCYNCSCTIMALICCLYISFHCCSCASDTTKSDNNCPEQLVVPVSPYQSPIWHPTDNWIGFNYTVLDSITYPWGIMCQGIQHLDMSTRGFWLIRPDGSEKHRIGPYIQTPQWSHDGAWLFYSQGGNIYKLPYLNGIIDTTAGESISDLPSSFYPTSNSDDTWITYDSAYNRLQCIWKTNLLVNTNTLLGYATNKGETRQPHWSSVSDRIAFIHYPTNSYDAELYTMSSSGDDWIRITNNTSNDAFPTWSPVDSHLAFIKNPLNMKGQLWLINADGNGERIICNDPVHSQERPFSWNPSGTEIVYVKYDSSDWSIGNGTLWIVAVSNGEVQVLANNEHYN